MQRLVVASAAASAPPASMESAASSPPSIPPACPLELPPPPHAASRQTIADVARHPQAPNRMRKAIPRAPRLGPGTSAHLASAVRAARSIADAEARDRQVHAAGVRVADLPARARIRRRARIAHVFLVVAACRRLAGRDEVPAPTRGVLTVFDAARPAGLA